MKYLKHSKRHPLTDYLNVREAIASFLDLSRSEIHNETFSKDPHHDNDLKIALLEAQWTIDKAKVLYFLDKENHEK